MAYTAIFGGTFNPLHIGHFEMLNELQNDDRIEKILLLPNKIPPHKECDFLADDETRLSMCKIAAKHFQKAGVSDIELKREGKSYSYDTILELKNEYPETEFIFVCGADMLIFFDKWYNYKELMKEVAFYVFYRATEDNEVFKNEIERFKKEGMRVILNNTEITNISSTEIRKDFKNSQQFLNEDIRDFLAQRGVYFD